MSAPKNWQWRPGMLDSDGGRVIYADHGNVFMWTDSDGMQMVLPEGGPDLTDPATIGAAEQLVRDLYDSPDACITRDNGEYGWEMLGRLLYRGWCAPTRAECIVLALEAL